MFSRPVFDLSQPIVSAVIGYFVLPVALMLLIANAAHAERIKDIAMVEGARSNQLIGFG